MDDLAINGIGHDCPHPFSIAHQSLPGRRYLLAPHPAAQDAPPEPEHFGTLIDPIKPRQYCELRAIHPYLAERVKMRGRRDRKCRQPIDVVQYLSLCGANFYRPVPAVIGPVETVKHLNDSDVTAVKLMQEASNKFRIGHYRRIAG